MDSQTISILTKLVSLESVKQQTTQGSRLKISIQMAALINEERIKVRLQITRQLILNLKATL